MLLTDGEGQWPSSSPALCSVDFYGPNELTYLLTSNQPSIPLRLPSHRDNHNRRQVGGHKEAIAFSSCPRCRLDLKKKIKCEHLQCPTSTTSYLWGRHLRIYCPSQNSFSLIYSSYPSPKTSARLLVWLPPRPAVFPVRICLFKSPSMGGVHEVGP